MITTGKVWNWPNHPELRLEASRSLRTQIHNEGGDHVIAIASRFGTSRDVFPVYGIGSGFSPYDALEAALSAAMDRNPNRYPELACSESDDAYYDPSDPEYPVEECHVHHVNGVPFYVDTDHDVMVVSLKGGW